MKYAIIAALACAAAWFLVAAPRIELAELNHKHARERVAALELLDEQRVELIQSQQLQIIEITDNEKRNRELLQAIAAQGRAQSRALEELKSNDETIAEYLRAAVPADISRLYQRTETTDPGAYRQSPSVPADAVRSAVTGPTAD